MFCKAKTLRVSECDFLIGNCWTLAALAALDQRTISQIASRAAFMSAWRCRTLHDPLTNTAPPPQLKAAAPEDVAPARAV